jgi:hypothetical protein
MDKAALISRLSEAAGTLLDEAFPAKDESGEPKTVEQTVSLADKIKAFQAARDWLGDIAKLMPDKRETGKGEQLRERFRSSTAPSRRGRSAKPESDETESGGPGNTGPVSTNGSGDHAPA